MNKPSAGEIGNCREWLARELELLPRLRVIIALGRVAFEQIMQIRRTNDNTVSKLRLAFAHGVICPGEADRPIIIASYHPSRQNTQTGLLKPKMLESVFREARRIAGI